MITLKDISTRELLAARNSLAYYDEYGTTNHTHKFFRIGKGDTCECVEVTDEELYAELNTREHIPNKKDAKTLRRLQAQTGLSVEEVYAKHSDEFYPNNRRKVSKKEYLHWVKVYGKQIAEQRYVIK